MSDLLLYTASAGFESALQVKILPSEHRSHHLHGHSFVARVRAQLPPGWGGGVNLSDALQGQLAQCVSTLDYDLLNNHLLVPTDENLTRWIRQHIEVPGIELVGIQSTAHEGADLDASEIAHIWRRYRFESAHFLPNVPAGHQCGRMHGHGFEVILHVRQNLAASDMGLDYDVIDELWAPLNEQLNHACLNDIPGLENPTSEALAAWIWHQLKPQLAELSWVTVYETVTAGCHFDGRHYRIWKEFRFESALRLEQVSSSDSRRQLKGHSYLLRLHLSAELDPVMNWTVDYGDVKSLFKPVYNALDHHLLDEVEGLNGSDSASVARWIKQQALPVLPMLDRIDLFQTPGCGVILNWGEDGPVLPV